tara:strand:- start:2288 stop:4330 length:2043 start_codon:yes stop_codon:yes gene_type:complete
MAYAPIAYVIPQYEDYANYWLKFYEPGTTTPKSMATDDTASTLLARCMLNIGGFPLSNNLDSDSLFIPYVDGAYDAYLFPTSADADNNDTANAIRIANDISPNAAGSIIGGTIFPTVQNMIDDTSLTAGSRLITFAYNAPVICHWEVVAAQTGAGDLSDATLDLTGSGLQARLQLENRMTPKHFGAAGDGVTVDTTPVQNSCNNAPTTVFDATYAIESVTCPNSFETRAGGSLKYVGAAGGRMFTFTGKQGGDFVGDGNSTDVNLFYVPATVTHKQTINSISGHDVTSSLGANNTQTVATLFGAHTTIDTIIGWDCTNTGNTNGSFPQTVATGQGVTIIGNMQLENCRSGLVCTGLLGGGAETHVAKTNMKNMADNGFYVFRDHFIDVGEHVYQGNEEPCVLVECKANIQRIVAIGYTYTVVGLQSAEEVSIGEIVGMPPVGTADTDLDGNLPRGAIIHRSGNVSTGRVSVGRISGQFAESLVRTGFGSGTTRSLSIGQIDARIPWVTTTRNANWNIQNFLHFGGVKQTKIHGGTLEIIDVHNELSGQLFEAQWGNPDEESLIKDFNVYILDSSGNPTTDTARFFGNEQQSNLRIEGGRWRTSGGVTKLDSASMGPPDSSYDSTLPATGYWFEGQTLKNKAWNGTSVITKEIVCTQSGDFGDANPANHPTFQTFNVDLNP